MGDFAGPAVPLAFGTMRKTGGLQQTTENAGVYTTWTFETLSFNFFNGLMDRPSNTQWRVLRAGYWRVTYKLIVQPDAANDRGLRTDVFLNGGPSVFLDLRMEGGTGKTNAFREAEHSATQIIQLAANDILTLAGDPIDGDVIDCQNSSTFSLELVRLI